MPSNRIVGSAETVAGRLAALIERADADEIMLSTMTHGLPERVRTLELVAEHWPA
jgi:alkanesulfonate monooxygenase SsuD/methylene tetrahydromethanopterin reductase-like flavin-dependent oxidoreductase (luciferase family)